MAARNVGEAVELRFDSLLRQDLNPRPPGKPSELPDCSTRRHCRTKTRKNKARGMIGPAGLPKRFRAAGDA